MSSPPSSGPGRSSPGDLALPAGLQLAFDSAPTAIAVTLGAEHVLVYANPAFRRLEGAPLALPAPIGSVLPADIVTRMQSLLDRAWSRPAIVYDGFLGALKQGKDLWNCRIWPLGSAPAAPTGLVIELHKALPSAPSIALQREVAERLLLSALAQADALDAARTSLARSLFLSDAGTKLGSSLNANTTRDTVAGITLPAPGAWCIVDLIELDGAMVRLAMVHADRDKQELLRELALHWGPEPGDPFGGPAVEAGSEPVLIAQDVDRALEQAAHTAHNLELLHKLSIGGLLTVPMKIGGRLTGAITFVNGPTDAPFSAEDVALAQSLAARSAEALDKARVYAEALLLREQAELATRNKLRFLGNMSHELRTPLNAIVGYVDVMAEGIHGPVTPTQQTDLERIRLNQQHLLKLVNELLTFARAGTPRINEIIDLPAHDAVARAVELVQGSLHLKSISYVCDPADPAVIACGDPERVSQILVNLLANAVKFTPRGGRITTTCAATDDQVIICVNDTGMGIAAEQLTSIFEPFIQVQPEHSANGGVGLGLAISRELAGTMRGQLEVTSVPGEGSCFTLTLPRARGHSGD